MLTDEDVARQIVAAEDPNAEPVKATPRLTEWSPEVERLTLVADRLSEVAAVLVAVNSKTGQYKAPARLPWPETAVDVVRAAVAAHRRASGHAKLLRHLYPNSQP